VIGQLWRRSDYPCGKRLVAVLRLWLPSYERRYGALEPSVRENLERVSPATLDRLTAVWRIALRMRRGGTKPGSLLRSQIPVQYGTWKVDRPGYLEADVVEHGGASASGDYLHSITCTDIYSGWVEQAVVWNKGASQVLARIREIEQDLPFPLLGFDCDNGAEFLNHHLWRYLRRRPDPVAFTRSRAYHKNDNAHVEQKNWSKVRLLLGYERYDRPELLAPVQELYRHAWRLLQNFFQPVLKLQRKERRGARLYKRYDQPQTPAERLLAWPGLATDKRLWLEQLQRTLDPISLQEQVMRQQQYIRRLLQKRRRNAA